MKLGFFNLSFESFSSGTVCLGILWGIILKLGLLLSGSESFKLLLSSSSGFLLFGFLLLNGKLLFGFLLFLLGFKLL